MKIINTGVNEISTIQSYCDKNIVNPIICLVNTSSKNNIKEFKNNHWEDSSDEKFVNLDPGVHFYSIESNEKLRRKVSYSDKGKCIKLGKFDNLGNFWVIANNKHCKKIDRTQYLSDFNSF